MSYSTAAVISEDFKLRTVTDYISEALNYGRPKWVAGTIPEQLYVSYANGKTKPDNASKTISYMFICSFVDCGNHSGKRIVR